MSVTVVPNDYDTDPARGRSAATAHKLRPDQPDDVHEPVARRLLADGARLVLDVGCGRGRLAPFLVGHWVGVDPSPAQLADAPSPVVRGDVVHLPVRSKSVDAVTALWMLYHLAEPVLAIREAHRVLKPGGWFVASAARRDDSPEVMPRQAPTTFDAEEAGAIVCEVFGEVEVETWDEPMIVLSDREAVRVYLRCRSVDLALADDVETPVTVTKRGCLVWARK